MIRSALPLAAAALFSVAVVPTAAADDLFPRFNHGTYMPYAPGATAVTYDETLVPEGAEVELGSIPLGHGTTMVTVSVSGLAPDRDYGAHVHTKPCGPSGDDAGPHFQQVPDPVQPSVDPAYANPENEVWLDFRTDGEGDATVTATGKWDLRERDAASFVIHDHHTSSEPGDAGSAGARLSCFTADF